jgi:hypothetical protein
MVTTSGGEFLRIHIKPFVKQTGVRYFGATTARSHVFPAHREIDSSNQRSQTSPGISPQAVCALNVGIARV